MDVETGDFPEDWVQHKAGADVCDEEDLGECPVDLVTLGLFLSFCVSFLVWKEGGAWELVV